MKMIVDIPDTMKDWILYGHPDQNDFMLMLDIIRNGTPLHSPDEYTMRLPTQNAEELYNILRHEARLGQESRQGRYTFGPLIIPNPNVLKPFVVDCPVSHPNPKECGTCIYRRGDAEKCAECMNGKENYVLEEEQNETAD